MDVAGSAGIGGRHDRREPPAAALVGILMPPQREAGVVVGAGLVRLPDLHKRFRNRPAIRIEHQSCDGHFLGLRPIGGEIALQRCVRLEVRPFGLRDRSLRMIVARWRELQSRPFLRGRGTCADHRQGRGAQERGKNRSTIEHARYSLCGAAPKPRYSSRQASANELIARASGSKPPAAVSAGATSRPRCGPWPSVRRQRLWSRRSQPIGQARRATSDRVL